MCTSALSICYVHHMYAYTYTLESLELELDKVVSYNAGTGN